MAYGYYGIGVYHPKTEVNIGTLWRTANILGAAFIFTVGRRYKHQSSDTCNTTRNKPIFHFKDIQDLKEHLPYIDGCPLVGIELTPNAINLKDFTHPERAIYLLGAEDHGLPQEVLNKCHYVVKLDGEYSMNVAVAGSIVLYHRMSL